MTQSIFNKPGKTNSLGQLYLQKGWCGAVVTEAVVRKCSVIKVLLKFRNIHKKTFVLESLFNKGPLGLQLY